ncbi:hypothetical protein HDU86_008053 [Geranomyces michiganensis]|nr:hypothetical protein HDU86_008053 [Geranomyces michiganensis]
MLTLAHAFPCYTSYPQALNRITAPAPSASSQYPIFQPRSSSLPRDVGGGDTDCDGGDGAALLGDGLVKACLNGDVGRVRSLILLGAPVNWHCTAKTLLEHPVLTHFTPPHTSLPAALPPHWTPLAAACATATAATTTSSNAAGVACVRCLLAHAAGVDERAVCVAVLASACTNLLLTLLLSPNSTSSPPAASQTPSPPPPLSSALASAPAQHSPAPVYPLALLLATTTATANATALSTVLFSHSQQQTTPTTKYPAATLATAAHAAVTHSRPHALRILLRAGALSNSTGGGGAARVGQDTRDFDPERAVVDAAQNGFWSVVRVLLDEALDAGGSSDSADDSRSSKRDGCAGEGKRVPLSLAALPPTPGIELSWEDVMVDIVAGGDVEHLGG